MTTITATVEITVEVDGDYDGDASPVEVLLEAWCNKCMGVGSEDVDGTDDWAIMMNGYEVKETK